MQKSITTVSLTWWLTLRYAKRDEAAYWWTEETEHLLGLTGLKRLNIAGTQITDDGLVALGGLQNLEWVCVNRIRVMATGVNRLKATRPGVEVMIGSEPGAAPTTAEGHRREEQDGVRQGLL